MATPEQHESRMETVGKVTVRVKSYKLGDDFICTVDNVDPGAVVARGKGPIRETAERAALIQVTRALGLH